MGSVDEYLDKCLAECPEGADEILLGEIAKRLIAKYGPQERIEVRDRRGVAGYFVPLYADIFVEVLPPELLEMMRREIDPNEPGMPAEEHMLIVEEMVKRRCQELEEEAACNGQTS